MPFRHHFARKEAREHAIAQNALQRGDLKEWHKHEAKAHRAGRHARSGLMHTEYMSFKENVPPMSAPVPYFMPREPEPIPVMAPMLPITNSAPRLLAPLPPTIVEDVCVGERFTPNTIVEVGDEMDAEVIFEPTFVEEPTTLVEYGEQMAPITYIDELAQIEAYMDSAAAAGYTGVMDGENVIYGEPQFVEETIVTSL